MIIIIAQVCDVVERVLACKASGEIWRACAMVGFLAASCGRETDDDDENDDHEVSAINARLIAEAILRETPKKIYKNNYIRNGLNPKRASVA